MDPMIMNMNELNKGVCPSLHPTPEPIFKGMEVVYIKDMEVECRACGQRMKKWCWEKHVRGSKHRENIRSEDFALDNVCVESPDEKERKQCRKRNCYKGLDLYRGENETCNLCIDSRKRWATK